jgi:hypothetical protein
MRHDHPFRSGHPLDRLDRPTAPNGPRIAEAGSTHILSADAHLAWVSITAEVALVHRANAIWGTLPAYQIPAVTALHCGGEV